ncbi:hypothetical protein EYF80_020159 [Liparis tanakae]|uniref:Uncharacterized protein n=1 Tax=Liparis tanakae TaxID=230148 RepID=A0A4Z2HV11_9TELE|nr:hypothetical protein EYF80_020159 [Liparis tanakae]
MPPLNGSLRLPGALPVFCHFLLPCQNLLPLHKPIEVSAEASVLEAVLNRSVKLASIHLPGGGHSRHAPHLPRFPPGRETSRGLPELTHPTWHLHDLIKSRLKDPTEQVRHPHPFGSLYEPAADEGYVQHVGDAADDGTSTADLSH